MMLSKPQNTEALKITSVCKHTGILVDNLLIYIFLRLVKKPVTQKIVESINVKN